MPKFFKKNSSQTNSKKILINARILDPKSKYDKKGELVIEDGKIKEFGTGLQKKYANHEIIDCKGNLVCPGIIDMQVHFRDPGQAQKEDIITGSKSAVSGGITSVVCQPNTKPVLDSQTMIDYLAFKAEKYALCNVYTYAAITKNMEGNELTDFGSLSQNETVVGFTDDGLPVMNAYIMRRSLEYAKTFNTIVAQHAEDLNISNKGCMNEGKVSQKLGVRGIANASESVIVARDIDLVRLTGGAYHVLHVSTKEALDHIRIAKKEKLPVTCEVSPHHFSLTDEAILTQGTNAKMNPPLRSEADRKALIQGLKDGVIDAIATDHAPHEKASKDKPLESSTFGIIGLETMLPLSLELYHDKTLSLIDLMKRLTSAPAEILKLNKGQIKKGAAADLCVIDLEKKWEFKKSDIHSKSHNTPFLGRKFKGRNMMTFVAGDLVYED
jgi:dihydroorotase